MNTAVINELGRESADLLVYVIEYTDSRDSTRADVMADDPSARMYETRSWVTEVGFEGF